MEYVVFYCWWGKIHGLNLNSAAGDFADANADTDRDSFTNLDNYLEWMATPHFNAEAGKPVLISLKELSRGYTEGVSFKLADSVNGKAELERQ